MNRKKFAGGTAALCLVVLAAVPAFCQTESPSWTFRSGEADPGGRAIVAPDGTVLGVPPRSGGGNRLAACSEDVAKLCAGRNGFAVRGCLAENEEKLSNACRAELKAAEPMVPGCSGSPICGSNLGGTRRDVQHVYWEQTLGYTFEYPFPLPQGGGGVSAVAMDSKENLWVFQRNAPGDAQLFKFTKDGKLLFTVGDDVILHQEKAHGMKVDAEDNVWICDATAATIKKLSPDGKLLMTIGKYGERGDWVESKGQRLLWQPLDLAFGANGDIYIGEGHGNESPNDTGRSPTNNIGAARVIHLDKDGKFINQWYGNSYGQGKFNMVHGIAVDPQNGDVWLGDREDYRLSVYDRYGKFKKALQMRNLTCAIYFDPNGQLWLASGQDGQILKLDRDGNVLGAIGNGSGLGHGQFIETTYMAMDSEGNLYSGDTSVGRVTKLVAPTH